MVDPYTTLLFYGGGGVVYAKALLPKRRTKMKFSPEDPGVGIGAIIEMRYRGISMQLTQIIIFAMLSGGREEEKQTIKAAHQLLHSVDSATTVAQNQLAGDKHIGEMAKHWAFFGPGISDQLDRLNKLEALRMDDKIVLSCAYAFLMARQITLELNGIEVPRIKYVA